MERLTEKGFNFTTSVKQEFDSHYIMQCMKKLQKYEDLEDENLLTILPCEIGTPIWWLNGESIMEGKVEGFGVDEDGVSFIHILYLYDKEHNKYYGHNINPGEIGNTAFFTFEEAVHKKLTRKLNILPD